MVVRQKQRSCVFPPTCTTRWRCKAHGKMRTLLFACLGSSAGGSEFAPYLRSPCADSCTAIALRNTESNLATCIGANSFHTETYKVNSRLQKCQKLSRVTIDVRGKAISGVTKYFFLKLQSDMNEKSTAVAVLLCERDPGPGDKIFERPQVCPWVPFEYYDCVNIRQAVN